MHTTPSLRPSRAAAAALALGAALLCVACSHGGEVEGGAAELEFQGGALDGSEDEALAAAERAATPLRAVEAYPVDYETPIEQLVEEMGLKYDEANAMIQLPEEVVRQLAAARKAQLDFDRTDTTPPQPMAGGRLAIRFRHLALDHLDDEEYEALLDGLVGRAGDHADEDAPEFPTSIRALDGKDVALLGYMIPIEWDDAEVLEFMLVRDLLACCFGGAPQPDEWVQVRMEKGKGAHYYPFLPVITHGRFEIDGMTDAAGYAVGCYRMTGTKVERE
ncbi:MAG: DUF3299 domain-containing protein [Planctomycetota bacterium]